MDHDIVTTDDSATNANITVTADGTSELAITTVTLIVLEELL